MKLRTIKRLTAALLCVAVLASVPALAAFEDDALPSAPVGSEPEAVMELPEVYEKLPSTDESFGVQAQSISAVVFSVTVPTALPIHMDAYGNVTCGSIVITNNSTESVKVKDAQITALNGWTLVDYASTNFAQANAGQHKLALRLGDWEGAIAANGGQKSIDVAAKIPHQGARGTQADIAQVIFVLGWKEALPPPAPADALPSFTIKLRADGHRRNGESWSANCTITLYAVSQVGDNVIYEGTSYLAPPADNYITNSAVITDIPANLEEGIVSIQANGIGFNNNNGTWTGSEAGTLVPIYQSSVAVNTRLELTLDISTTVKEPTLPSAPPTPTPT